MRNTIRIAVAVAISLMTLCAFSADPPKLHGYAGDSPTVQMPTVSDSFTILAPQRAAPAWPLSFGNGKSTVNLYSIVLSAAFAVLLVAALRRRAGRTWRPTGRYDLSHDPARLLPLPDQPA